MDKLPPFNSFQRVQQQYQHQHEHQYQQHDHQQQQINHQQQQFQQRHRISSIDNILDNQSNILPPIEDFIVPPNPIEVNLPSLLTVAHGHTVEPQRQEKVTHVVEPMRMSAMIPAAPQNIRRNIMDIDPQHYVVQRDCKQRVSAAQRENPHSPHHAIMITSPQQISPRAMLSNSPHVGSQRKRPLDIVNEDVSNGSVTSDNKRQKVTPSAQCSSGESSLNTKTSSPCENLHMLADIISKESPSPEKTSHADQSGDNAVTESSKKRKKKAKKRHDDTETLLDTLALTAISSQIDIDKMISDMIENKFPNQTPIKPTVKLSTKGITSTPAIRERMIEVFENNKGQPILWEQIQAKVSGNRAKVWATLCMFVNEGLILQVGKGRRGHPFRYIARPGIAKGQFQLLEEKFKQMDKDSLLLHKQLKAQQKQEKREAPLDCCSAHL